MQEQSTRSAKEKIEDAKERAERQIHVEKEDMEGKLQVERKQMEIDMKKIKELWQAKLLNKNDEFKDTERKMEEKIRVLESDLREKAK